MSDTGQREGEEGVGPSVAAREMEIVDAWALRFDGYAYEAVTGLVLHEASTAYVDHGQLPDDPLGCLAVLFALQRWLGKWGGEAEPREGCTWRRFRELFLSTTAIEVPERYEMDRFYGDWHRLEIEGGVACA